MVDLNKRTGADTGADNRGLDMATGGAMHEVDWGTHDAYWRDNYGAQPYSQADRSYEYYQPAYKYGHESAFLYGGREWDAEIEHDLERGWEQARGDSTCTWNEVKDAVRDAYVRSARRG